MTNYEALYSNDRKDIILSNEEINDFKENNLEYYTYRDLKERGLIVKSDEKGLRLYDRNTSTKSAASAIVYSYNFQNNIDFTKVIEELETNIDRRTQIAIIDNEGDVVYYIADLIQWPETKLKEGRENTNDDPKMKELVDKGYQVNSGLKFGTHYRVYNYESEHAPWLIHITEKSHNWLDVARMIRVGHGVNKIIVLAYEKYWISLKWTKP
ncbi:MAG: hypothetical protein VYE32_04395 [Candidatus Thermoplasmatota archaeon]|nr:hypothetical protein [Candidatus Thermoplasmatota archaeon]